VLCVLCAACLWLWLWLPAPSRLAAQNAPQITLLHALFSHHWRWRQRHTNLMGGGVVAVTLLNQLPRARAAVAVAAADPTRGNKQHARLTCTNFAFIPYLCEAADFLMIRPSCRLRAAA
jgi:hypothetical protein